MRVKVFYPDRDGTIHLTKKELESLLDEVYNEGYTDGRRNPYFTWTSPYYTSTTPYITTCETHGNVSNSTTISSSNSNITYTSSNANITGSVPTAGQVLQKTGDDEYIEYSKLNVSYKTA